MARQRRAARRGVGPHRRHVRDADPLAVGGRERVRSLARLGARRRSPMIAALAWLKEHKQLAALAGLLVAVFFAGLFAGRASVRQPAVHEVVQERAKDDAKGQLDQTVHAGREKITITDYAAEPIQYAPPATSAFLSKKE